MVEGDGSQHDEDEEPLAPSVEKQTRHEQDQVAQPLPDKGVQQEDCGKE